MEATELSILETSNDLIVSREPAVVLQEAQKAALALTGIIAKKKRPVILNGEQYLEFEDLQILGRFYGITAKVTESRFVERGDARGYEARAIAYNVKSGQEVSAADAECLNDEVNWHKKPMFQLRSMAQTRACAKALRNVLAWVVVLAGYRPTPAEEMTGREFDKPALPPKRNPELVTNYVTKLGEAILNHVNGDTKGAQEILKELTGKASLKTLSQTDAMAALLQFEKEYMATGTGEEREPGEDD